MSDWTVASLADIAEIRFSNVDKKAHPGEIPVRLCNYLDVYTNNYITAALSFMEATATPAEIERFRVEQGDTIITKDSETPDDIGIPAVVTDEIPNLVCGYHLALIKPHRDMVDSIYLSKQLGTRQVATYFSRLANGSTRYGLSSSAIAATAIPLAPLPEQLRISQILSSLDQTIEHTEALITKYQQIKTGLMHDLFTRGITKDGKLRPPREEAPELYKKSPIGWIPKEWACMTCTELCEFITVGIVVRPTQYYVNAGVPAFRSANIREDGLDTTDFVFISERSNELLAKSQIRTGDILSVRSGYPGTSAVVPSEYSGSNCIDILLSRPRSKVISSYLSHWINSPFGKDQVLRWQGGLAQQHFNVAEMRRLLVALPNTDEQERIVERLSAIANRIAKEKASASKLLFKKQGLMHDLLTGRVRVNVGD